ncbi:MAG: response regulator transcription factor [Campylobacterales bacterium]|nr:response regulator transcription factor [Campylobacterales bacterium]
MEILIVEDDNEIADLLKDFLEQYNMTLTHYTTPSGALNSLEIDTYDLAILDLSLPEMDGMELCKEIKSKYENLPIIISSARGELEDKVAGLEVGADDYLPKPYHPREMVARIQSVVRRYKKTSGGSSDTRFKVDEQRMIISLDSEELDLTTAEYELLAMFIGKSGHVLTRDFIANNISTMRWDSGDKSIDVLISRIRKKIGDNPRKPTFIKSIKGVGYKFIV